MKIEDRLNINFEGLNRFMEMDFMQDLARDAIIELTRRVRNDKCPDIPFPVNTGKYVADYSVKQYTYDELLQVLAELRDIFKNPLISRPFRKKMQKYYDELEKGMSPDV